MNFQAPRAALGGQALCAVDEFPDGGGKGLTLVGAVGPLDIFVVRKGAAVSALSPSAILRIIPAPGARYLPRHFARTTKHMDLPRPGRS